MSSLKRAGALRAAACALVCFLGLVNQAFAQTSVAGAIASDVRWTKAQSPYLITGDVQIVGGARVTIEPGVQVYVADGKQLVVSNGALIAVGSKDAPILISSQKIYANQAASRGSWGQVQFLDGTIDAATRLEYVTIEYGHGLKFVSSSPAINYLTLQNNAGAAISTDLTSSPAGIGNRAINNDIDAITVPAGVVQGDLVWGLRGIQYFVPSGVVEVGSAPSLSSLTPNTGQLEESVDVQLSGEKLTGLKNITFDKPGISATIPAPATAESANAQLTIAANAATGPVALTAMTDAGEIHLANAFTILSQQPQLLAITPNVIYVGQGNASIDISAKSLTSGTEVMLGSTALSTTIVSPTAATVIVPNQSVAGTLQISLRTPDPSAAGTYFTSTSLPLQLMSPTLALTPSAANAQVGQAITLKVVLPYPAPTGGVQVNVSSTNSGVASVGASATIAQGATEANISVNAIALGTATIRVTKAGYQTASAVVNVTPPPALSVSPSLLSVAVGTTLPIQVNLVPAPAQDTVLTLTSSNPSIFTVPAQVTASAGAASVSVNVTGVANGQAALSATAAGYSASSGTILVSAKSIVMPTSAVVAPASTRTLAVALNAPAPAGGLVISLSSSNTSILTLPSTATVAEGQTSVIVSGVNGLAQGTATVTATASGFQTATTQFTVRSIYAYVSTGSSLPVNFSQDVTVFLSEAAPAGGISVNLILDNPALASLSATTIDIPSGDTRSSFAAPRLSALAQGTVRISTSSPGLQGTNSFVTLLPAPGITVTSFTGSVVPAVGKSLKLPGVYIQLGYAPGTPVTVTLTSSQPDKVRVPATVVVPAGSGSATFDATGLDLTQSTATITASAPGFDGNNTPMNIDVLPPAPYLTNLDTPRVIGGARDDFNIFVGVNRVGANQQQIGASPISVVMSLPTANPVGIVSGFYADPYTSTTTSEFFFTAGTQVVTAYVGSPTAVGSYSVRADVPGGASVTLPVTQVVQPKLSFSVTTEKAVHGFRLISYNLTIQRQAIGTSLSSSATVYLTSSDTSKLVVPTLVTIPAGQSSVRFQLDGIANTDAGAPVTIDAVSTGFESPAEKLSVDVIDPEFYVDLYYRNLIVGQEREYFDVYASNGSDDVTALADTSISFSIAEASPAGIIDGIYDGSGTNANLITSMVMRAGRSNGYGYFGVPTAPGSFRVQVQPAGYSAFLSDPINVVPGTLFFNSNQNTVAVGKSLSQQSTIYVFNDDEQSVWLGAPITVQLTSSDPGKVQVPATVTIPAGSYNAGFKISGLQETNGTPVHLDATASGFNSPETKPAVTVVPVEWRFAATLRPTVYTGDLNGITRLLPYINNAQVGQSWGLPDAQLPLSFQSLTPSDSTIGFLASNGTTPITSVSMSATSGFGSFYVGRATQAGSYRIQAQLPDGTMVVSPLVGVAQDSLGFNAPSGAEIGVGTYYTYRVSRKSNISSGETISLACIDTSVCTTPATVSTSYTFTGSYADFNLTGLKEGQTVLTAAMPNVTPGQLNVVVAKTMTGIDYLPATTTVGGTINLLAYLHTPASGRLTVNSPRMVTLTVSAPGIVSVPATVTIPVNWPYVSFSVTAVSKGTVTITASEPGSTPSSGSITVN